MTDLEQPGHPKPVARPACASCRRFRILANMSPSQGAGEAVFRKLERVTNRFLAPRQTERQQEERDHLERQLSVAVRIVRSSLSLEPPLVLWALNTGSPSLGAFDRAHTPSYQRYDGERYMLTAPEMRFAPPSRLSVRSSDPKVAALIGFVFGAVTRAGE